MGNGIRGLAVVSGRVESPSTFSVSDWHRSGQVRNLPKARRVSGVPVCQCVSVPCPEPCFNLRCIVKDLEVIRMSVAKR